MKSFKSFFVMTLTLFLVFCFSAFADGIQDRMKQRLPQIIALKNRGIIGETNTGYLGFVTGKKEKQDVVSAENEDRKAAYAQIAIKAKESIQVVQRRRAVMLFSNGTKGHYYQNEAGAWVRK
ncbi:YdbL family protein [uncultured Desulfobacter sp.]|uniref:YdbL family protein n=1 Tax=uncultured Desulfobacter sp. TaxID=240139 RepID=UPI0029F4B69D|nr:YdbL family protein [uncultured Desulfobacter sp.]